MNKLLKIIFPFYNSERHNFLYKKWWFRLLIILYIIGIIFAFGFIISKNAYSSWGWCYDLAAYSSNISEDLKQCSELAIDYRWSVIGSSTLFTIIIHYLIQLIFFKVIINFIALGNKK